MEKDYKYYLDNGIFEFRRGEFRAALANLDKSIELKNDFEVSYFYRGAAHQALENFDEAMLDYTKSLQLNPKMVDAYYNRAKIVLERKDIITPNLLSAVKDLEKALEIDDKFVDALFAMAAAKKKLGKYEEALEYLDRLLTIEPEAVHAKAFKKLILQKYL